MRVGRGQGNKSLYTLVRLVLYDTTPNIFRNMPFQLDGWSDEIWKAKNSESDEKQHQLVT
jgi:hypothetical protein